MAGLQGIWSRPLRNVVAAMLVVLGLDAMAQVPPKRLSDVLNERPPRVDDFPLGLSWRVPEEVPGQAQIQQELLRSLSGTDPAVRADPVAMARLRGWIGSLPVTGRVPVASGDARWLEVNPARNPIIGPLHQIIMSARPETVTLVTETGALCSPPHAPGADARAYLAACRAGVVNDVDWAWIAQPDGRVQRSGIALWNHERQDLPAPGAWIWAPPRSSGWPERFSEKLAAFLATQGPSAFAPTRTAPAGTAGGIDLVRMRGVQPTASDWGDVGLLQTPTARMGPAGSFGFSLNRAYPYTYANIFVQPTDWLSVGIRYANISNVLYSDDPNFSGNQAYKDKSIDFKAKLWDESAYVPSAAIGFRDLSGTGLFSSEYLVANKRTGPLDWGVGLGWGYLAGRGNFRNPLASLLGAGFEARKGTTTTGQFNLGSYFRGPASFFGGVQYQTPWEPILLKLEYDGNNYRREPFANNLRQSSPWNAALVYRMNSAVDISLGVERGNTAMLGVSLHAQLDQISMPKLDDPVRIPVSELRPAGVPDWGRTARDLATQTDWTISRVEQGDSEVRVLFEDPEATYWQDRVDRAVTVLHRDAPASVNRFVFVYRQRGVAISEHLVRRDAWVAERTQFLAPFARRPSILAQAPASSPAGAVVFDQALSPFEFGLGPDWKQSFGGPEGFIMYQASVAARATWRLRPDTWVQGRVRYDFLNNYDQFRSVTTPSLLPPVRTKIREYVTSTRLTMPELVGAHAGKLSENQYFSVYGGYLEQMFAGVGAEWLYRPQASRVAFGIDVNEVKQRGLKQNFDFLKPEYRVATGHGTLYWDTGWNQIQVNLSAGRYLAGDMGATIEVFREFDNGVRAGAWATKTNVSSTQFGEGSFDKGFYLSVPFDAILTRSSGTLGHFVWRPLTRDGGAKLDRQIALYDLTRQRDDRALRYKTAPQPNDNVISADRRESWTPAPAVPAPAYRILSRVDADKWRADPRFEERLVDDLYRQGFRNIRVEFDGAFRLTVTLAGDTLRPVSRAVGRAARTALRFAPLDAREIRIVYAETVNPVVRYDFMDLARLARFFDGAIGEAEIADVVGVETIDPSVREANPLARLADLDSTLEPRRFADMVLPDPRNVQRVATDVAGAVDAAGRTDWTRFALWGAGITLGSSLLDRRLDNFARDHAGSRWVKGVTKVGDALPWAALGGAAALALDTSDPARSKTSFAAVEAGGVAILAATGLKYLVGRQRPGDGASNREFQFLTGAASYDSFPSRHAITSWAVVTPFAEQYRAPWLYGVAAITNAARVGSRQHWFSDTVASSFLGYGIGKMFHDASREPAKGVPKVSFGGRNLNLAWEFN